MIEEADDPHRPWLRLYRRGSARFQQLEPHYRGTLIEVLRYTDSSGRINLDGRSPEEALLRLLGNTRSFRPVLKAALAEGFRIEMCSIVDGHLVFQSWSKYQPGGARQQSKSRAPAEQAPSASQEQSNDAAAASQERRSDIATASQEQSNDRAFASNLAKSLNTQKDTRGEKRRLEESREEENTRAPATPAPGPPLELLTPSEFIRMVEAPETFSSPTEPPSKRDSSAVAPEHLAIAVSDEHTPQPTPSKPSEPDYAPRIAELEKAYPSELITATRLACQRSRRSGRMAPSIWLGVLEKLGGYAPEIVVASMQVFVDRHGTGEHDERYLLGIVRKERDRRPVQQRLDVATSRMPPPARQSELEDGMGTWDLGGTT